MLTLMITWLLVWLSRVWGLLLCLYWCLVVCDFVIGLFYLGLSCGFCCYWWLLTYFVVCWFTIWVDALRFGDFDAGLLLFGNYYFGS